MDRHSLIRLASAIALLLELAAGASPAFAQTTATATMAVSIEVTPNCTVAAQPLAFGAVAAADAPLSAATATIEVACGPNVAFTIQLDDGQNASDGTRRALDPATGQTIGYDIFADAAHTLRWGSLAAESVAGVTTANGTERLTAYGGIGSEAQFAPGQYGDLITVTTSF